VPLAASGDAMCRFPGCSKMDLRYQCKWQQVSYGRELQVDEKPYPTDPSVTERQLSFLQSSKVNASLVAEPRQCTDG